MADRRWYWCLEHGRAEQGQVCRAATRMGPYDSAQEAARWKERVEQRNESWDDDDEAWRG